MDVTLNANRILRKKTVLAVLIITTIVAIIFLYVTSTGFLPIPVWVRHIYHATVIEPKNLYQPIVLDHFLFHEKGYTKSYSLSPRYFDIYEIGCLIGNNGLDSNYQFAGRVKAEFFSNDKLLFEKTLSSVDQAWHKGKDMYHYSQISFMKFEIPLQNKYWRNIAVRLTVLEPDPKLRELSESIELYIAVSASP